MIFIQNLWISMKRSYTSPINSSGLADNYQAEEGVTPFKVYELGTDHL